MTESPTLSIVLTGSGGAGVMTAGQTLLDAATGCGLYGLLTRSTGPQIRGGEAAAMIRLSDKPVDCHGDRFDIVVALDFENVQRFAPEIPLDSNSLILGDSGAGEVPASLIATGARIALIPMAETAKSVENGRISMVALGALARMIGLGEDAIVRAVAKALGKKKPLAVATSEAAAKLGAALAADLPPVPQVRLPAKVPESRWSITGNEASGYGAIKGGVRFSAGYPITPATEILEYLAPAMRKTGGVMVQAEDELASINMILGASYGGVPSITATAGPGLSLMVEALGLGVASEIPVVVVNVMRSGPSTGIATKTEQADLNIAVYGMHGDAPHVVTAPLSVGDCMTTTQWSVHLAEAMQTPVIVLSDQSLGQARAIVNRPEETHFGNGRAVAEPGEAPYERYAHTDSGVSPMAIPGTAGLQYTADGLTHNTRGTPSSQASDHVAQLDKRHKKIGGFDYGNMWAEIEGEGELAIVTWGSSTAPVREAIARAKAEGINVKLVALRLLAPIQPGKIEAALAGVKKLLVIEQSHSGQFWRYLRAHCDLPGEVIPISRPGPLPIRPGEVHDYILKGTRA